MNLIVSLIILFSGTFAFATDVIYPIQSNSPDIIVQMNHSKSAQAFIIDQLRSLIQKKTKIDPMQMRLEKPVEAIALLNSDMESHSKKMVDGFLNFNFNDGKVKIKMEGLQYEIKNAVILIKSIQASNEEGIDFQFDVELSDTLITADRIDISFLTPPKDRNAYLGQIHVALNKPSLYSKNLNSLKMKLVYNLKFNSQGKLELHSKADTYDIFESITTQDLENDIKFDPGEPQMNDIEIEIGSGHSTLNKDGIKVALQERKKNIAQLMFSPLVDLIRTIPEKMLKEKVETITIPTLFTFPMLDKEISLNLHSFGNAGEDQLRFAFDAAWDGRPNVKNKAIEGAQSTDLLQSTTLIHDRIHSGKVQAMISVKQELLSDLAMDLLNGQFKSAIPKRLSLGMDGIQFKMAGDDQGAIHADILLNIGTVGKIITGKKRIKLPVIVRPRIEILNCNEEVPTLQLSIAQIELNDREFESMRFKKLIRKIIRNKLHKLQADTLVEVPLAALKGLDPSVIDIQSDGYGRLNIGLSLNPDLGPAQQKFWEFFPALIK